MSVYHDRIVADPHGNAAGDGALDADTLLTLAAVASNADNIDDAIDSGVFRSVKEVFGAEGWAQRRARYTVTKSVGFNPTVKRTLAFCKDNETGDELLIAKGLLDKVLDTGGDGAAEQWMCADLEATRARAKAADEALSEDAFKTIAVGVRVNGGPSLPLL